MRIQNQTGNHPTKWDKTGVVVEVRQYHQYIVHMDGTGKMTIHNRIFLRQYLPVHKLPPWLTIMNDLPFTAKPTPSASSTPLPNAATSGKTCQREPTTKPDPTNTTTTPSHQEQPTPETRTPTPTVVQPQIDPPSPPSCTTPTNPEAPTRKKPPLALRQLMDFNCPGLKEIKHKRWTMLPTSTANYMTIDMFCYCTMLFNQSSLFLS